MAIAARSRLVTTLLGVLLLSALPGAAQLLTEERGYDRKGDDYTSFRARGLRDCTAAGAGLASFSAAAGSLSAAAGSLDAAAASLGWAERAALREKGKRSAPSPAALAAGTAPQALAATKAAIDLEEPIRLPLGGLPCPCRLAPPSGRTPGG
jgi:hypothetical protein